MISSRDQIAAAMRKLDSATLRGKLATGELTEMAQGLAEEILAEREHAGMEDPDVVTSPRPPTRGDPLDEVFTGFLRRPFGWGWGTWLAVLVFCVPVIASFGTHARQTADQAFLYGVILLQSLCLAGILRSISAIFTSSLSLGLLGKLLAAGMLTFALGGLTLCSLMARHGWGGG